MSLENTYNCYCFTVKDPTSNTEEDIYIEADDYISANVKLEHRLRNTVKIIVSGFQVNAE